MTEKRSDYRKKEARKKPGKIWSKIRSAFASDDQAQEVDVNPAFERENKEEPPKRPLVGDGQEKYYAEAKVDQAPLDKGLCLKKRLNHAILIVFVLIVLVLLALFHL